MTRELLTELLRSRGVQVTAAESGAPCLAALDGDLPDIIISDIAMPGLDGFQLMEQVRERPPDHGGRVPAVALSAYAGHQDKRTILASGFDAHLSKPVDMDELIVIIATLAGPSAVQP